MKDNRIVSPAPHGRRDLPASSSGAADPGGSPSSSSEACDSFPCPQCEAVLADGARFCHLCGVPLRGPDPKAVSAEASELVTAAHHSSPKIIVQDHVGDLAETIEGAKARPEPAATGRDLLTTTPYRGLDVQCEDEAVFFTEELEHDDKTDDFSDLVGRRVVTRNSGLRTTLVVGGLALFFLGGAVWLIERKPTPKRNQTMVSSGSKSSAVPARARPKPSGAKDQPAPIADAPRSMAPGAAPAVAAAPAVIPPTTPTTPTTPEPTTPSPASEATPAAAPTAQVPPVAVQPSVPVVRGPAVVAPPPTARPSAQPAAEASVADQLAARASSLLARNRVQAQKLALAALAQNPAHPIARRVMARIFEGQAKRLLYSGANAAAAQSARRALRYDPTRANALFYLGVALNEQRRRPEASRVLNRFVKRCPSCGYNSMYARQLLTTNRRLAAAKAGSKATKAKATKAAMSTPTAPPTPPTPPTP